MAHADSSVPVSLCPSPALPEEQRHHNPAPGTSPMSGLRCILLLHQESPTEKRKNQECRDMDSHLSTPQKDAFPSGFCLYRGKDPSKPTATLIGQKAKPQRELCPAKIHPWPKDRPLGTSLPIWHFKKKTESRDLSVGYQGLSRCSGYVTSRDLLRGFIHCLTPNPHTHELGILILLSPITHCHLPC